ncbi:MAG: cytochrome C peroxidase [Saprospiraceae bacterium]|nr:cytochrome C peroxidase [Saprospiraceae bacterium]
MKYYSQFFIIFSFLFILFNGCSDDPAAVVDYDNIDLTDIEYSPENYTITYPQSSFPAPEIPEDNPMTRQGVDLGKFLFYDPVLSADSTMSCASCHLQIGSFTNNLPVSVGIDNIAGTRSAMSLLNVGFYNKGLFWDGRTTTLEELSLLPVTDEIEFHNEWPNVIGKFRASDKYRSMFRKAFGIENSGEITKELAAKAMSQFQRTLNSSGESKYDRVMAGKAVFTDQELMGFEIYFDVSEDLPDGECFHCHNDPLMTTNQYLNNGLDEAEDFSDFADLGHGKVTGIPFDNGRFRIPTLRNIVHSAPYMHDGRFQTLEEVLDHYNSGGKPSPNKDPLIQPLGLTQEHLDAVLVFLHTLTDETFMNNPEFADPTN